MSSFEGNESSRVERRILKTIKDLYIVSTFVIDVREFGKFIVRTKGECIYIFENNRLFVGKKKKEQCIISRFAIILSLEGKQSS